MYIYILLQCRENINTMYLIMYVYIYIYQYINISIYVHVCVCMSRTFQSQTRSSVSLATCDFTLDCTHLLIPTSEALEMKRIILVKHPRP